MKLIVEQVTDPTQKIECWTRLSPVCTREDLDRAQFIVYSIPPSMEPEWAHHAPIKVFKERKKPFIIAIREDGDGVVLDDLKQYFPNDTLTFFPKKRDNSYYVIFGFSAAIVISFLCYFKWIKK